MAKQAKNTPTVAIAPTHPGGQGHATKGGHVNAWRAMLKAGGIPLTATVTFASPLLASPWRPTAPGTTLYNSVLAQHVPSTANPNPAGITIGQLCVAAKAAMGLTQAQTMGHLVWLYTWPHAGMLVNGQTWAQAQQGPAA